MINEALTFRREGMPCDVHGARARLDVEELRQHAPPKSGIPSGFRFPIGRRRGRTPFSALQRKGFKLSLWLCCDYDLGVFEEQQLAGAQSDRGFADAKSAATVNVLDGFVDERLSKPTGREDNRHGQTGCAAGIGALVRTSQEIRRPGRGGVQTRRLRQVIEHPDRKWGNGMTDEEMHNLYPVIYAKQMARGFENHTQRRAMVYSAGGYAGVQQYVATWAGDTGGGAKPLASMLNLGFSGHSNHSCDMDVGSVEGIHFGFLQTWAQQNNWDYWYQPWLLEESQTAAFRQYGRLRYKLLPYLYSTAAEAALTGYPVMRAMSMVYPDDPAWDACSRQYMLGDFLLVSAFSKESACPKASGSILERQTAPGTGRDSRRDRAHARRRIVGQERRNHSHLAGLRSRREGLVA